MTQRGVFVGSGDKPHAKLDVLDDPGVLFRSFCTHGVPRRIPGRASGWVGGWADGRRRGCSSLNISRRHVQAVLLNVSKYAGTVIVAVFRA